MTASSKRHRQSAALPELRVDYCASHPVSHWLGEPDVLAIIGFGNDAPSDDPRCLHIPLSVHGTAPLEIWRGQGSVEHGRDGDIRWASDGQLLFGAIEVEEHAGGIETATAHAYSQLSRHVEALGFPHFLRICNYFDAITEGDGDAERYRNFCIGRAAGWGFRPHAYFPAATAIGRTDGKRQLQVYWLAARTPGIPLENPRQVSAYHYPRQYGRQSPSFARAMLPPTAGQSPLLLSGTAAVVGHASQHDGHLERQLDEIFHNFDSLLAVARQHQPALPSCFGSGSRLKVYVRDAADLPKVEAALANRLGAEVPHIILHATICRRELAIEIDGIHG